MGCINCGSGFCELCEECPCCKPKSGHGITSGLSGRTSDDRQLSDSVEKVAEIGVDGDLESGKYTYQRVHKSDEDIKDPHSTGRKRAALLFPINKDEPCEWKGLTNCGGGKFPVIGCVDGKQRHIHHGPDKNTLNNSRQNIHKLCHDCHNIWHSQNDPVYDPESPDHKQHEPRRAEFAELVSRYGGQYKAQSGDAVIESKTS